MYRCVSPIAFAAAVVAAALLPACVNAGIPATIPFQGLATDAAGQRLNGVVALTFRYFNDATNSEPILMIETQDAVTVNKGVFSTQLGSGAIWPSGGSLQNLIQSSDVVYVEVLVGQNGAFQVLKPRVLLTSAPYAMRAGQADSLSGSGSASFLNTSATAQTKSGPLTLSASTQLGVPLLTVQQTGGGHGVRSVMGSGSGQPIGYLEPAAIWGDTSVGVGAAGFSSAGLAPGVYGDNDNTDGIGVLGDAGDIFTLGSLGPLSGGIGVVGGGTRIGVYGASNNGTGVIGVNQGAHISAPGVYGITNSMWPNAVGVKGELTSQAPNSNSAGVMGVVDSTGSSYGTGVYGSHAGAGSGVYGVSVSGNGIGGESQTGTGVTGWSHSGSNASGVSGVSTDTLGGNGVRGDSNAGIGVMGVHLNSTGTAPGVDGETRSTDQGAIGVYGKSSAGPGVSGDSATGAGVYGDSVSSTGVAGNSQTGYGVTGFSHSGYDESGVYGVSFDPAGGIGVRGDCDAGIGVVGIHGSGPGAAPGVDGESHSMDPGAVGVYGISNVGYGVRGYSGYSGGMGTGVDGKSPTGTGVSGSTTSGVAVLAHADNANAVALQLDNGPIKVSGAAPTAFTVTADNSNSWGPEYGSVPYAMRIDNPLCNGDPNAMLIVTHNAQTPQLGQPSQIPSAGVFYDSATGQWSIFLENRNTYIIGDTFNVLVIKH